jgi:hypothetical protein
MTTTAHISQILLDTITHISAVPERVRRTASTVDMGVPDRHFRGTRSRQNAERYGTPACAHNAGS